MCCFATLGCHKKMNWYDDFGFGNIIYYSKYFPTQRLLTAVALKKEQVPFASAFKKSSVRFAAWLKYCLSKQQITTVLQW